MTNFGGSETNGRIVFGAAKRKSTGKKPVRRPTQVHVTSPSIQDGKARLETRVYDKKTGKLISRIDSAPFPIAKVPLAKSALVKHIQTKGLGALPRGKPKKLPSDAKVVVILRDNRGWHTVHRGSVDSLRRQKVVKTKGFGYNYDVDVVFGQSQEEISAAVDELLAWDNPRVQNVLRPEAGPLITEILATDKQTLDTIMAAPPDQRKSVLLEYLFRDAGWQHPNTIGPWVAPAPKTLDESVALVASRYKLSQAAVDAVKSLMAANPSAVDSVMSANVPAYSRPLVLYDWLKQNASSDNILGPYFGNPDTAPAPPVGEGESQTETPAASEFEETSAPELPEQDVYF